MVRGEEGAPAGARDSARGGWSVDGLTPARVERPGSAEDLAGLLGEAVRAGEAVVPVGGGRALGMGAPLKRWDLAIETSGLDRVLEYEPADLTVTVEAGASPEAVASTLAGAGQLLPLDPFASPGHTVGGILASGWSGPLRLGYRHPRDFLIGLRVALPDGSLVRSGGRVVKNVSGYDLNKLHLGALGSTGVIVEASFKVFTRPPSDLTLETRAAAAAEAWDAAATALSAKAPPVALELLSPHLDQGGPGEWRLLARLAGARAPVERIAGELGWPAAGAGVWEEHARRQDPAWARLSVPARRLPEVTAELPHGSRWWASPGVGTAHWVGFDDPAEVASVRAACEAAGGSLVLLAAPPELKQAAGAFGRPPATAGLMSKLREAFDPTSAMGPGRFVC
ncbi:MAG: FAD-binding oxidoreductase [Candidatus Dormibacterales bacterium]